MKTYLYKYFLKVKKSFSLIEIMIAMSLIVFILTIVIGISLSLVRAQSRVQSEMFLTETAKSVLENMSNNLRLASNYLGNSVSNNELSVNGNTANILDSKIIIFEKQGGDTSLDADQNAYCTQDDSNGNKKLFKIEAFNSDGSVYTANCNSGTPLLPEKIKVDYLNFDIKGSGNGPFVRIKLKLSDQTGDSIELQTTIAQRQLSGSFAVNSSTTTNNTETLTSNTTSNSGSNSTPTVLITQSGAHTAVFSGVAWTYYANNSMIVTIIGTNTTSIRYTTNGTNPVCVPATGNLYSGPITVSSSQTIKAIGCNDTVSSSIETHIYVITP